jgi:hypothetical protein
MPLLLETLHREAQAGTLERLNPTDCLNQYATSIQSNRRNLLLVASDANFPTSEENKYINGSHVYWAGPFFSADAKSGQRAADSYQWICSAIGKEGQCSTNVNQVHNNPSAWRVGNVDACGDGFYKMSACDMGTFPVEYCLSQPAEPHCRLQFDTAIAVLVTFLNFGKSCCNNHVHIYMIPQALCTTGRRPRNKTRVLKSAPKSTTPSACCLT